MHSGRVRPKDLIEIAADYTEQAIIISDESGLVLYANRSAASLFWRSPDEMTNENIAIDISTEDFGVNQNENLSSCTFNVVSGKITGRRADGRPVFVPAQIISGTLDEGSRIYISISISRQTGERCSEMTRLRFLAMHDPLTHLANRQMFHEHLERVCARCRRHGGKAALLHLDLDRFKPVNDSLGHEAGDDLLRQVAKRLRDCVRQSDVVARLGGDEFAVILDEIRDPLDAELVARKILAALAEDFPIRGRAVLISGSVGIALIPADGEDGAGLVRNADRATYAAKEAGANTLRFFTAAMNAEALRRAELGRALRRALEREEFRLHLLPVRALGDRALVAAEAQVRWDHPERGMIEAADFLDVAEDSGAIVEIGAWMLDRLITRLAAWRDAGLGPCRLSARLSLRQLRRPELLAHAFARMSGLGLAPALLELEIGEAVLRETTPAVLESLALIGRFGAGLAIGDFGSDQTSLRQLRRFRLSALRIDRAFLSDLGCAEDRALVRAMIAMAGSFGLPVIGKGVEDEDQARMLRDLGGAHFQGPLAGPPLAEEAFHRQLAPAGAGEGSGHGDA